MEEPLVSIVMVNYNHEDFLREAIDSVLAQTYKNWELILVDDGSTDASVQIIKEYTDSRIRAFFLEKNRHICYATNYGFAQVRGTYVARLDSDDVWREDKLEKQMEFFDGKPEARICFTKLDIVDADGVNRNEEMRDLYDLYNSRQKSRKDWMRFFFFGGNSLIQSTMMFDAEILQEEGGFNLAYMQTHDFDFFVRLIKKNEFYFLEEPLVSYRRLENKNSSLHPENDMRFFNEHMSIRRHFCDGFTDELFKEVFGEYFVNPASETPEELKCEQAFLLCKCVGYTELNPLLGMMKLEELFRDPETVKLLEEKYCYTPKEFYHQNTGWQYYSPRLDVELKDKDEIISRLRRESKFQKEHIESLMELKDLQQQHIGKLETQVNNLEAQVKWMEESASWKMTQPLRDAKKKLKKD